MRVHDSVIRKLSTAARAMLINHIDREVPLDVRESPHTRASLMNLGLLRGAPANNPKPKKTALTEHGRYAVDLLLGDYADALVRAGLLEEEREEGETALEALRRLKALRSQMGTAATALRGPRKTETSL